MIIIFGNIIKPKRKSPYLETQNNIYYKLNDKVTVNDKTHIVELNLGHSNKLLRAQKYIILIFEMYLSIFTILEIVS